MSPDRAGYARYQVYADLVAGLLDARDDPASNRFDIELDHALDAGTITAETARRLRFWQRASVRALADHVRTVVPTALGALEASRREAETSVEGMADTLGADPQVQDHPGPDEEPAVSTVTDLRGLGGDTPVATSSPAPPRTSTLGTHGNRLIVADLVTAAPDTRTERR